VPRLIITGELPVGFVKRSADLMLVGSCDDCVLKLLQKLDWLDELDAVGSSARHAKSFSCVPGVLTEMLTMDKDVLEGRWCDELGEPAADIVNSTIYWPQDPSLNTELKTLNKNRLMMELEDRLYYATVSPSGDRVQWSDGATWYRGFMPPREKHLKGSSESGESAETRATDTSSMQTAETGSTGHDLCHVGPGVITVDMLDGKWCAPDGVPISTISSSVVTWADDSSLSSHVSISEKSGIVMELDGQLYLGDFNSDRTRIKWSDGEVWHRAWNPFGSGSSGPGLEIRRQSSLKEFFGLESRLVPGVGSNLSRESSSEECITYAPHCDTEDTDDDE